MMKRKLIMLIWIAELISSLTLGAWASEIKSDEQVQLYPAVAHLNDKDEWEARVTAWVYEREDRPGAKALLARWLGLDLAQLSPEQAAIYEVRTQLFRFDSERNKKLSIRIGGQEKIIFPLTNAQGISQKKLIYKSEDMASDTEQVRWLNMQVVLPATDKRNFSGRIMLVPTQGLAVISDVDDTIKASHVIDKKELLLNTFVRPFVAAEGMAGFYQALAKNNVSTSFHYVSASPHQLYPALVDFISENQFPAGSLHLRHIKITEEVLRKGSSSARHKHKSIRDLLQQFPARQFVLIGDSGEADPEIYADIAADYSHQVKAVFIRNVTNEDANSARYKKIREQLDGVVLYVFDAPDDLPTNIHPPHA